MATATKSGSKAKLTHKSVAPLPSGGDQSIPAVGTTVMIVQKTAIGYVLAEANRRSGLHVLEGHEGRQAHLHRRLRRDLDPAAGTPEASPADVFPASSAW